MVASVSRPPLQRRSYLSRSSFSEVEYVKQGTPELERLKALLKEAETTLQPEYGKYQVHYVTWGRKPDH